MYNKAFSQLTDAEKARKLGIAIRNHAGNNLTPTQIRTLLLGISPKKQYSIAVHSVRREVCQALIANNTIHIFVPEKQCRKENSYEQ